MDFRVWEGVGPWTAREVWSSAAAVQDSAEGDSGLGVSEPDSLFWLEMEFNSEGLRRLLGKVRPARRAGSGAPGLGGVSTPGRATSLGRFPGLSWGLERGVGWPEAGYGEWPQGGRGPLLPEAGALASPANPRSPNLHPL